MKTRKTLYLQILACISILGFYACEEDPTPIVEDSVDISTEFLNLEFESKATEAKTVTFVASSEWSANPSATWVIVSPLSGATGDGTINISVQENTTTSARTAKVVITAGSSSKEINVTQKATGTTGSLVVTPTEPFNLKATGEVISIVLKTDLQYVIEIEDKDKLWITQVPTKNVETYNLQFTISPNSETIKREGKIVIRDTENKLSQTVIVNQEGKNDPIIIGEKTYNLKQNEQKLSITLTTKLDIKVTIPTDVKWVTYTEDPTSTDNVIILNIAGNSSTKRSAIVTFESTKTKYSEKITINQEESTGNKIVLKNAGELEQEVMKLLVEGLTIATITELSISGAAMNEADFTLLKKLSALASLDISKTAILTIPNKLFFENKIIKKVLLPEGLTTIGESAFEKSGLTAVKIPTTVKTWISTAEYGTINNAFAGCVDLKSVEFPEGLTTIGASAFAESGVESVRLPTTLLYLGSMAFGDCTKLTSLELPEGLKSVGVAEWTTEKFPEQHSLHAFSGTAITSLRIPTTIQSMWAWGENTFSMIPTLKNIELPEGLKTIGQQAFSVSGLTSVTIPSTIEIWGNLAFYGCEDIASVTFTDGLKFIANGAFTNCKVTTITIPSSVTEIKGSAFQGCTDLTTVNLNEGLVYLNDNIFLNCEKLKNIEIPSTVEHIGYGVFASTIITSVEVPAKVKSLGANAFSNCAKLTSIKLNEGLENISSLAFWGTKITSITIPSTVTDIDSQAFYDCTNLSEVKMLSSTPPSISSNTFSTRYIQHIFVPKNSSGVYLRTDYWDDFYYKIMESE